jgi:hypothetical protein
MLPWQDTLYHGFFKETSLDTLCPLSMTALVIFLGLFGENAFNLVHEIRFPCFHSMF